MGTTLEKILQVCQERKWTLASAESLTGGLIGAKICDFPGVSSIYRGGIIAYQYQVKTNLLGVDAQALAQYGAVTPEVALQMAREVRKQLNSEVGISTTGVAGPGAAEGKPAGFAYIGIVTPSFEEVFSYQGQGDRNQVREQVAQAAFRHLEFSLAQDSGRL